MTTQPLPKAADADHLTKALRDAGVLAGDHVTEVSIVSSTPTILSHIWRLGLAYDGPAADAPRALVLKTAPRDKPNNDWNGGQHEVAFYNRIAPGMPAGLVPRCFEAHGVPETGAWHVLLEDLSDSHTIATRWPLPPTLAQCEDIVRTWARFHAAWWDDPRLGVTVGAWGDPATFGEALAHTGEQVTRFGAHLGDNLSAGQRALYARLLAAAPRLLARQTSHRHMTVVHGDSHVWNCFLPRHGASGGVRLFDWDAWRLDIASDDLAYMMALHWYPGMRHERERHLLDVYHAELVARGVSGFSRQDLQDDYRLSVLWQTLKPVWQFSAGIPAVIWWNHLERIHLAAADLDCGDLL